MKILGDTITDINPTFMILLLLFSPVYYYILTLLGKLRILRIVKLSALFYICMVVKTVFDILFLYDFLYCNTTFDLIVETLFDAELAFIISIWNATQMCISVYFMCVLITPLLLYTTIISCIYLYCK